MDSGTGATARTPVSGACGETASCVRVSDIASQKNATPAATDKHACKGQNACKGKGGCKTEKNACKGHNACKGKGGCRTDGKAMAAPTAKPA